MYPSMHWAGVCLARGVVADLPGTRGRHPPSQPDTRGHGQAAGTHPTGMHSRNSFCIRVRFRKVKYY